MAQRRGWVVPGERRLMEGGRESPQARVERLVATGHMPREAVTRAEQLWAERLHLGVRLPNGETIQITRDDLYHVIVDDRIWRHPERIEAALENVFEIRRATGERRQAFSRWQEADGEQLAYIILELGSRLWSLHLIDDRRLRRYLRKEGEVLWNT